MESETVLGKYRRRAMQILFKPNTCMICLEHVFTASSNTAKCCCAISTKLHDSCLAAYVAAELNSRNSNIKCPNCFALLNMADLATIIPKRDLATWSEFAAEAIVPPEERFYCPYPDCSALMWKEPSAEVCLHFSKKTKVTCYACARDFCIVCEAPWHGSRRGCLKTRNNDDEKLVLEVSCENGWKRCRRCRSLVERTEGCPHMICRCGFHFCYLCGSEFGLCFCNGSWIRCFCFAANLLVFVLLLIKAILWTVFQQ